MSTRLAASAGSFVFFCIAPGSVAGLIPYALTGWTVQRPIVGLPGEHVIGGVAIAAGVAILIDSFWRFALEGRGTPAPIAPTKTLVASGLYRYVRNPMYVGVLVTIAGQALLLGSVTLLTYAAIVWLAFHLFVRLYEEPLLARRHGASYEIYRVNVRRWRPRLTPWRSVS